MLDDESWLRLLEGLVTATRSGLLEWEASDRKSRLTAVTKSALIAGASGSLRQFTSQVQGASYELSSEDPRGRAPYELVVREVSKTRQFKQIGSLRSSVEVENPRTMELNHGLEQLFRTVDSSVEPPSAVVTRLLRGMGLPN